jgi:hypothetical protein
MGHPLIHRNRWKMLARRLTAQWRANGCRCHICGRPIEPHQPLDVDHLEPVSVAPHRAYDVTNLAPAHASCNRRKGARKAPTTSSGQPVCELTEEETLGNTRRWWGDTGSCLRLGDEPCPRSCPAHEVMVALDARSRR